MSCNCGCNFGCGCDPNPCHKPCTTTSTTSTTTVPCIGEQCDELYDCECVRYRGQDLLCYGIKDGTTLCEIIQIINDEICKLNPANGGGGNNIPILDCRFGTLTAIALCPRNICGVTYEGYGALYNWYAIFGNGSFPIPSVIDGRNSGGIVNANQPGFTDQRNEWRVPSNTDWTILTDYLGGEDVAGGKLKTTCITPFTYNNGLWNAPNTEATNEVNWAGVPGGFRASFNGSFQGINEIGFYWSSTPYQIVGSSELDAYNYILSYSNAQLDSGIGSQKNGSSIRLVRPATSAEQNLSDGTTSNKNSLLPHYIGNSRSYITVKIGNQVWTAQNLIDTEYNDGTIIPEEADNTLWSGLSTGAYCGYGNGSLNDTEDQGDYDLCGEPIIFTTTTTSP